MRKQNIRLKPCEKQLWLEEKETKKELLKKKEKTEIQIRKGLNKREMSKHF
jgi:hypothetical protein